MNMSSSVLRGMFAGDGFRGGAAGFCACPCCATMPRPPIVMATAAAPSAMTGTIRVRMSNLSELEPDADAGYPRPADERRPQVVRAIADGLLLHRVRVEDVIDVDEPADAPSAEAEHLLRADIEHVDVVRRVLVSRRRLDGHARVVVQ